MTYQVKILPSNISFIVEREQTILEAALNQNIRLPNRCQVGACAACMCRLIEGRIRYQLEPMLTEKEQAQGWIFACQAKAESNLVLTYEE